MVYTARISPSPLLFGTDFLSRYDVDVDLPDRKIVLYKTLGTCHGAVSTLAEPVYQAPIVKSSNALQNGALVEVSIQGHTLRALLDTGAPYSALFRDAAKRAGLSTADLANDPRFRAAGTGPNRVGAIRHKLTPITVGEVTVQNLPVGIVDQHSVDDVDMILGMDFMSRVHVWFGFSSGTVLMQYPPLPSPRVAISP